MTEALATTTEALPTTESTPITAKTTPMDTEHMTITTEEISITTEESLPTVTANPLLSNPSKTWKSQGFLQGLKKHMQRMKKKQRKGRKNK
jgi:hypothetical protein